MTLKIAGPLLVLALAAISAPAQQTGVIVGRTPGSAANAGLRVVRLLEAAEKSLNARGKLVEIDAPFGVGA